MCKVKQTLVLGVSFAVLWCLSGRVTVLLCPLTALCRQHAGYLQSHGMSAVALTSESSLQVRNAVFDCLRRRALAVLVTSREQIAYSDRLVRALEACEVGLVAFDEAHTWLSWPVWRPPMGRAPARLVCRVRLALTATVKRACEQPLLADLGMGGSDVVRHRFFRSNLALHVAHRPPLHVEGGAKTALQVVEHERDYRWRTALKLAVDAARHAGNAIIHVRSRREADNLAAGLQRAYSSRTDWQDSGAVFFPYHAERGDRQTVEDAFASRRGVVVVAMVAFGLGIDSPAVRAVIHMVRGSFHSASVGCTTTANALSGAAASVRASRSATSERSGPSRCSEFNICLPRRTFMSALSSPLPPTVAFEAVYVVASVTGRRLRQERN